MRITNQFRWITNQRSQLLDTRDPWKMGEKYTRNELERCEKYTRNEWEIPNLFSRKSNNVSAYSEACGKTTLETSVVLASATTLYKQELQKLNKEGFFTLQTSGEDHKPHSKRVEKIINHTRNECSLRLLCSSSKHKKNGATKRSQSTDARKPNPRLNFNTRVECSFASLPPASSVVSQLPHSFRV